VATGGIASLWKPVINVTDLDDGEAFWSALSGLSPQGRHGQFSVLDTTDEPREGGWILLQLVPRGQVSVNSGTHLDFRVDDVAGAVTQIEEIGGVMVRPPGIYAPEGEDLLEWAVMQDPFGNEFCIIRWPLD
jgi:predicted enzyme related to lactoylglutathione lyase